MKIILDAMGGDKAPLEVVKGAVMAKNAYDISLTLVGNKKIITRVAKENGLSLDGIDIVHTEEVITMEDDPMSVIRAKKNSSMAVGLRMLKEEGDAFVSAGNTGALHAGSSLIIRPIKGIQRAAIATVLPLAKPMLMLDCGANTTVTPHYLMQWAVMGSIYMKNIFEIDSPAVGLLNNGAEEHKGTPVAAEAHKLLRDNPEIWFIGNVEGTQIVQSPCDVLVTDGFTGNITLKLIEGMGKFFMHSLKGMYKTNAMTKMSFFVMKEHLRSFKKQFDASEHGGAPLLGLRKPVIKAHGSSDAAAIANAIRQAIAFVRTGVIDEISEYVRTATPTLGAHSVASTVKSEENTDEQG